MRELSLAALSLLHVPPVDAVRAAEAAGFTSMGLRLASIPGSGVDNDLLGNSAKRAELRKALADAGIGVLDAEVFRLSPADGFDTPREAMLEAAHDLGARHVGVVSYEPSLSRNADMLGELATAAKEYSLSCQLEFMGFSAVKTLRDACTIIDHSGAENAYVLVDILHLVRTGTALDYLAQVPPRYLAMAQLCDAGHGDTEPDPVKARAEAVSTRLTPGSGALPIAEFIEALPPGRPLSVEVPCPPGADPSQHAERLHRGAAAALGLTGM